MAHLEQERITSARFCFSSVCEHFPPWDFVILPDPSTPAYSPCPGAATALPGLRKCSLDPKRIFLCAPRHTTSVQWFGFVLFKISGLKTSFKIRTFSKERRQDLGWRRVKGRRDPMVPVESLPASGKEALGRASAAATLLGQNLRSFAPWGSPDLRLPSLAPGLSAAPARHRGPVFVKSPN